ncbi:MAG TPA: hypothetical protein VHS30_02935 [Streptosporangiaceae bacterium]|jgi:glycine/D-amino acid oxidase-like deaminating enzyme|nr:hypothetical protein [Streptosporangiaceae bacterium]
MSSPASRIVIIGAGIGGLTLALLLRRRGIGGAAPPGGPAAQVRDAYLAGLPERLAWIHGYDILARSPGRAVSVGRTRRAAREAADEHTGRRGHRTAPLPGTASA